LIRLWKANQDDSPKLATRVPSLVLYYPIWGNDASRSMEREKFISFGLSKYMDFWKVGIVQSPTYEMKMNYMWSTKKMFCCICQNHYRFKI
jgi:hypothetical protein